MKTTTAQRKRYSLLVDYLKDDNQQKATPIIKEVIQKLEQYLKIVLGATDIDAKECAQQAFLNVYEKIKADKIWNEKFLYTYMVKSTKHEYLRITRSRKKYAESEPSDLFINNPADQIDQIVDKERAEILKVCLEELDEESRDFILEFINRPNMTTKEASRVFKMSGANVRTRKSRITRQLHESFQRKSEFKRKNHPTTWYRADKPRYSMVS